ncbi:MAG: AlpA family phage regulatory protein [Thermoanaerobaculia bacterium]|nr:AlpA family phage regulatory protein [Thermoanaerobaculia bacterium]
MTEKLIKYLRIDEILALTGVSRATIWRWMRKGEFPARRRLGPNAIAWVADEVAEWLANRPAL